MKQLDAGEVNFSILRIVLKADFVARLAEAQFLQPKPKPKFKALFFPSMPIRLQRFR